jgi:uncharacterized metal-binding protein
MELKCAICRVQACREAPGNRPYPAFCAVEQEPETLRGARRAYDEDENHLLALAAARTEADGYPHRTRLEETMGFAQRIGAAHLGIATCVALLREAGLLLEIFEAHGFRVSSVCCKVGSIPKEDVGVADGEKIRPGQFEPLCNPIAQAELLNQAKTQLNVLVGLCVGHDSLFFRHSQAPVTVFIAKDRVTGHNPAAVLYTSHSFYSWLTTPQDPSPR